MCSNIRGPAILPSLVTCPMITVGILRSLQKRRSRDVHSRTWLTLPGAASISPVYIVCIESITSKDGVIASACSKI